MTEQQPQDQPTRDAALDPARSCIVQAPAGSGKTELLTQRFLRLLAVVERPEEIIAITFTRKAAGEMRDRILAALELGRAEAPPQEPHRRRTWVLAAAALARDAERNWSLLASPRRLRIETIDALNAWLARQLPLSSRLGAVPVISDDPEPVYREAARQVLLAAGGDAAHAPHAAALLSHLGGRFGRAEDLLVGLLKSRDHWLAKVVRHRDADPAALRLQLEDGLRHLVEEALGRVLASLPPVALEEAVRLGAAAAGRLAEDSVLAPLATSDGTPGRDADELPRWRALARLLLTAQGEWRKPKGYNRNLGFPPDAREAKAQIGGLVEWLAERASPEVLHEVTQLPEPGYGDARWAMLEHLLALLPTCAATLSVEFAARGESDYVGIARAALDALGEPEAPTDLALALDCRINHLLVDEFQDTSQGQVELLERLTAGWTPGDGRSLFCVGDPMQSIYRFREADVGRFLRAQQAGIGGLPLEPLQLSVNFRSQAGLVDWVSSAFPGIFPAQPDLSLGAVPFAPSVPWHAALDGAPVECRAVARGDQDGEAAVVLEIVERIRAREPEAEIAILVRGRKQLARITPALRAARVPCQAVEIEPLAAVPAIRDLEALTRALCHRADRTAWLALLRAPWCGLALADLLVVAGTASEDLWTRMHDPDVLAGLSADGRDRLARVTAALAPAVEARSQHRLSRVVAGAWLALGGPATLEGESELADARCFLEFLDQHARHGDLDDPPGLSTLLADLYAAPETSTGPAVQLLTIHKAKGLEFDHVILPGLDRRSGRSEKPLLRWLEQVRIDGTDLLLAPVEALGEEGDELHAALGRLDARREQLELDRVLYVAVTRARRRLYLLAGIDEDDPDSGEPPAPPSGTLLDRLWPATGPAFLGARDSVPREPGIAAVRAPARLRRLAPDWSPPAWPDGLAWRPGETPALPANGVEYDWSGREARAVGLAVHRLLQVISRDGPALWPADRLATRRGLLEVLLREAGLVSGELAGALDRCEGALRATLADPRGCWLLDPAHEQAASERRVSGWLDGQLINGIVDRSFVADGTLWIVDYKTGRHEGGALEAFLDREQLRYREQLERYARLLAGLHDGPIRLGLYFPLHAGWREWPAPAI